MLPGRLAKNYLKTRILRSNDRTAMAKKHILNLVYEHNFVAVGLFSPEKDYRVCWLLDKHLSMSMKRLPDFRYPEVADDSSAVYAVYHMNKPALFLDVYLLPNRSEKGIIFREPKNMDYLLLFKSSGEAYLPAHDLQAIRKIPQIQAAFQLNLRPAKKAAEFFFDFEMYLARLS